MSVEFYVYDADLNFIGEISEYTYAEINRTYGNVSKMNLTLPLTEINASILKPNNIIVDKLDLRYGYQIQHYSTLRNSNGDLIIELYAYSLNFWLSYRVIEKQQRFYGEALDVIRNFVRYNCIEVPVNRIIPKLGFNNDNPNLFAYIDSTQTGGTVLDHLIDLSGDLECTFEIIINYETRTFELDVFRGIDKSIDQNVNPVVIFSSLLENVLSSNYFENYIEYKNVAVIAGEGEGINRTVSIINDNILGLDRREIYIDARDLSSTYYDENNVEITLTEQEYLNTLNQRGYNELKKLNPIKSYEANVDDGQYQFGNDIIIGDKVTFMDEINNITLNARVTNILKKIDKNGIQITPSFGNLILANKL